LEDITNYVEYLATGWMDKLHELEACEKHLVLGAKHALIDHLARAEISTQTGGGRLRLHDLMGEAERILHRTSGALSLRERLKRDAQLREDMIALLKDYTDDTGAEPLKPVKPNRYPLVPIPVQTMEVGKVSMEAEVFSDQQKREFEQYFGTHPDLLEGAKYFGNSEKQ